MIRRVDAKREHLATASVCEVIADTVRRGESVRIVGLGTLAEHTELLTLSDGSTAGRKHLGYRLTLIAAVASRYYHKRDNTISTAIDRDVRHLARALGAPVEVWAPARTVRHVDEEQGGMRSDTVPGALITTVRP